MLTRLVLTHELFLFNAFDFGDWFPQLSTSSIRTAMATWPQTNPNFSSVPINWCPFMLQANYFSPFGFSILYFVWSWPCYPQALHCLLVWNPGAVFKWISLALNSSRLSCLVFWYYSLYFFRIVMRKSHLLEGLDTWVLFFLFSLFLDTFFMFIAVNYSSL